MNRGPAASLHLLVHAPQRGDAIADELGRADYSYYFVMQRFLPVLARLGEVTEVRDPVAEADALHDRIRAAGGVAVMLLFLPPNKMPIGLRCPVIPVFAWEYSTLPTESWGGEPRNDWREALRVSIGAITHSRFASAATLAAMHRDYPVCSLPAPTWEGFAGLAGAGASRAADDGPWRIDFHGVVLDTHAPGWDGDGEVPAPPVQAASQSVELRGTVYTSVFNPNDQRKNFHDGLTAFVWAHRERAEATLLLKLVHHDASFAMSIVRHELRKLAPYRCRIVVIHGYLDDAAYRAMVLATRFVVNSSRGEGQCLPLMEFMSAGRPALAPAHTAMAEYVTAADAFVVAGTREWTHWPHDPRVVLRCFRYRLDWESLRVAYLQSWECVQSHPRRYAAMSAAARVALYRYCSGDVVHVRLWRFLRALGLPARRPPPGVLLRSLLAPVWPALAERLARRSEASVS